MAQILNGELQPGDRLKETELAQRFGLSRTPVREALRQLETRGLLAHAPHRGMVVTQLEPSAISELYVMRETLDVTAAVLAAQHATETEITAMRHQIARDHTLIDSPEKLAQSNRAFHAAIFRAAHNRFLLKAADTMAEALALLGPTTLSLADRGKHAIEEHAAIVQAIADRDQGAAEHAARTHIRSAFKARLLQMDESILQARPKPHLKQPLKPRK